MTPCGRDPARHPFRMPPGAGEAAPPTAGRAPRIADIVTIHAACGRPDALAAPSR